MAHIAIFCDGTWSSVNSGPKTHVLRLSEACDRSDQQKIMYFEGVGAGTGRTGAFGRWVDKLGGGLFGWGLNRNILGAYQALCRSYQPGDKIVIFGFSRGAYTARSLVGLIRKCGILADPTASNLRRAFRLYRRRGAENSPDAPHIRAARRVLSPRYATSQSDVMARGDDSCLVRIAYLGVWDTVGALGIPSSLLGRVADWWNTRYEFHDTSLSHLVEAARHAVALDERRKTYAPSLWDNLDNTDGQAGLNGADQRGDRPYQQTWFIGDHAIVGGSAETRALTELTLNWVWQGAMAQGLQLKPGTAIPQVAVDAAAPTSEIDDYGWVYRVWPNLLQWRDGPGRVQDLDGSVRVRLAARSEYRPGSLNQMGSALTRVDDRPGAG
ncbi:DUF2235 domain-containing protein [Roseobacter sp.]|uniref:DUF2235 domain-containing protein n=1 Tax=Roseobacter sp. TaxID=1907202 RepID=UPI003297003B